MSAVGSRSHHHYSPHSSATTVSSGNGRSLSTTPNTNSPIVSRFSERRLSAIRESYRSPSRSSDDQSTEMITIALAKAQSAVLLDQRNNVTAALDGYSQCCAILAEVIAKETDHDDITRLRQIHDTYSVRMHVLSSMQVDSNPSGRQLPPLPMGDDLDEFEDAEDEGYILRSMQYNTRRDHLPLPSSRRPVDARPFASGRLTLQRSSSSRNSAFLAPRSVPPARTKPAPAGTSGFGRGHSRNDSLGSLEEIPKTPSSSSTLRAVPKPESGTTITDMADEEMDDAAFLERITRGFTSDEEILDNDGPRPSTGSSLTNVHQSKKSSEGFVFENIPPSNRNESVDFVFPSPNTVITSPDNPSPTSKPTHDRVRNQSSPLPQSTIPTPQPSSARKNLSLSGAQPMIKSLSANNAIPNVDEVIVTGTPDAATAVAPKIKKRPNLIRVVSESTMRSNSGARLSTFEMSPGSPSSTGSILTPGTTNSSSYLTDVPSAKALIVHDREGASAPEDTPEDPYLKPYWLMRAITLSMRNQKGAYINTRLFVPQSVWTLKNVKLKATEEKISCFHSMAAAVKQVLDTEPKNVGLFLQVTSPSWKVVDPRLGSSEFRRDHGNGAAESASKDRWQGGIDEWNEWGFQTCCEENVTDNIAGRMGQEITVKISGIHAPDAKPNIREGNRYRFGLSKRHSIPFRKRIVSRYQPLPRHSS